MTSVFMYSSLSFFGFCLIVMNVRERFVWPFGVLLLALAPGILVHDPIEWVVLAGKVSTAFFIVIAAAVWPRAVLRSSAVFLIFEACVDLVISGPSKTDALPTIGMLFMAASFWNRRAIFVSLLVLGFLFSVLNIAIFEYRSEAVLIVSIILMLILHFYGKVNFSIYFILMPICVAFVFYLLGVVFVRNLDAVDFGFFSLAPTASNVERSLMSFFAVGGLVEHPLGRSFAMFSSETFAAAFAHGRELYSSSALDPHNFFSFFAVSFGVPGVALFIAGAVGIASILSSRTPAQLICVLVPVMAVVSSFFPYATEYRLVWAVACGALLSPVIKVRLYPLLKDGLFPGRVGVAS